MWERQNDTIQDARLQSLQIHVEKCDVCGASISLEIPVAFREVPRCPYCSDPISVESLEERRDEAIAALRAEHRDALLQSAGTKANFSFPFFLLLLCACWPAALVYAWYKWQADL